VIYVRDVIITTILAAMGLLGGIVGMIWVSIWFVTSEKVAFVFKHAASRSARKISCVAALSFVYCYIFEYSALWTTVVMFFAVIALIVTMIASWVVRIAVVRLMVLPACMPKMLAKHVLPNVDLHAMRRDHLNNGFEAISIVTEDNNVLDGMVFKEHSMQKLESSKQKWIIMFLGNGAHYEHCADEARNLAISLNRNALLFNYRGVGRSAGLALEEADLVRDGTACLNFLSRNYQVTDTSNVLLFGHSLGGSIATSLHCQKSFRGHLINDRSFSSLAAVPMSWIEIVPAIQRVLPQFLRDFAKSVIDFVVSEIGWSMNAGRALLKNPCKLSRTMVLWHRDDEIINFKYASLHSALIGSSSSSSSSSSFVGLELAATRAQSPHNMTIVNDPTWGTFVDMARGFLLNGGGNDKGVDSSSLADTKSGMGGTSASTSGDMRTKKRRVL